MSWGSGGKHIDEILHVAADQDRLRAARQRRQAGLTVADQIGRASDLREVLEALGLAPYIGHDKHRGHITGAVERTVGGAAS